MELSALNRTPIGAAARGVGRFTAAAAATIRGAMVFAGSGIGGWQVFLNRTRIDYAGSLTDPANNSAVAAVVGWIARNFPDAPVQITSDVSGTPERLRRGLHPGQGGSGPGAMLALLRRPNPYMSGVLMWRAVVTDLYATGNAYIVKIRAPSGRVIQLWWIPKRFIRPMWPTDGSVFISHYEYTVGGVIYRLREEDVVHLRDGIDPNNPRLGLSKLASLFREIYTDDEAANFTAQLLTNLGVPGVVIAPANTGVATSRTDPEAVKTAFMEKFGGDKRGEPLVLTAPTDVKVLSFSPEQMNLRELRKVPEERISGVLGIAAMVAGLGAGLERSTFTNYGEARKAAYEESCIPLQTLISADMDVQLLPDFAGEEQIEREGLETGFDYRHVKALQESIEGIWKRNESSATKGLITRATFKRAIGEPVDEQDDDVYVIPNNYLVMPAGGNQPPGGTQALRLPGAAANGDGNGLHAEATEVRCSGCNRLLAEQATPPYRFTCPRCKVVNEHRVAASDIFA
jgi:HK97 family phage portal protein